MRVLRGWKDLIAEIGESFLDLLKAELDNIGQELAQSGKQFGLGVGLLAAAGALGFWTLGILTATSVVLLALVMPLWGAILVISAVFLGITGVLGWLGMRRLKRVESPALITRRRVDDHLDWWRHSVLPGEREPLLVDGEDTEEDEE